MYSFTHIHHNTWHMTDTCCPSSCPWTCGNQIICRHYASESLPHPFSTLDITVVFFYLRCVLFYSCTWHHLTHDTPLRAHSLWTSIVLPTLHVIVPPILNTCCPSPFVSFGVIINNRCLVQNYYKWCHCAISPRVVSWWIKISRLGMENT